MQNAQVSFRPSASLLRDCQLIWFIFRSSSQIRCPTAKNRTDFVSPTSHLACKVKSPFVTFRGVVWFAVVGWLFPTCQVRVLDFITVVLPPPPPPPPPRPPPSSFLLASFLANLLRRSCLASSGSQCAPLDLNRKDPLAVCTPGPQPQGSDRSVHPWTSTARIRSQCARLDLNRKDPMAVCTAGPQPQGSDSSVHRWTSTR